MPPVPPTPSPPLSATRRRTLKRVDRALKTRQTPHINLLGPEKVETLIQLLEKGQLTARQIRALCYPSKSLSTVQKANQALRERGLTAEQVVYVGGEGKRESLHVLTRKGFRALQRCGLPELEERGFRYREPLTLAHVDHRIALLDFWVAVETSLAQHEDVDLQAFIPEWQGFSENKRLSLHFRDNHGTGATLVPDAVLVLRHHASHHEQLFFVEIDMSTETLHGKRSLVERFERYQLAFNQMAFQEMAPGFDRFERPRLLFIADTHHKDAARRHAKSRTRAKGVARKLREIEVIQRDLEDLFLFAPLHAVEEAGLLGTGFLSAGEWTIKIGRDVLSSPRPA